MKNRYFDVPGTGRLDLKRVIYVGEPLVDDRGRGYTVALEGSARLWVGERKLARADFIRLWENANE